LHCHEHGYWYEVLIPFASKLVPEYRFANIVTWTLKLANSLPLQRETAVKSVNALIRFFFLSGHNARTFCIFVFFWCVWERRNCIWEDSWKICKLFPHSTSRYSDTFFFFFLSSSFLAVSAFLPGVLMKLQPDVVMYEVNLLKKIYRLASIS